MKKKLLLMSFFILMSLFACDKKVTGNAKVQQNLEKNGYKVILDGLLMGSYYDINGNCVDGEGEPTECLAVPTRFETDGFYLVEIHIRSQTRNEYVEIVYFHHSGNYFADFFAPDLEGKYSFGLYGRSVTLLDGICEYYLETTNQSYMPPCAGELKDEADVVINAYVKWLTELGFTEKEFVEYIEWLCFDKAVPDSQKYVYSDEILFENGYSTVIALNGKYYYSLEGECVDALGNEDKCEKFSKVYTIQIIINVNENQKIVATSNAEEGSVEISRVDYYDTNYEAIYNIMDVNVKTESVFVTKENCWLEVEAGKLTGRTTCEEDYQILAQGIIDSFESFSQKTTLAKQAIVNYFRWYRFDVEEVIYFAGE